MRSNFIRRSVFGVLSILRDSVFSDEISRKKGFLQLLDKRFKLISVLFFIILTLNISSLMGLTFLYSFCLFLALISKINLIFFLKRTLIFIPIFTVFICLPVLFNNFASGFAFILRVTVLVSFAILLSTTTRHLELLKTLRVFKVPRIFVMTIGMCYRYIYLFLEITGQTYLAIKSRVGDFVKTKSGQKLVAWNIASLWNRSIRLNEEVYKAMLSRGFNAEPYAWENQESEIE